MPQNVVRFLEAYIDSVEQLEVLVLLCEERGQGWTAAGVSKRLKTSRSSVEVRLAALVEHGLLEQAGETLAYTLTGASDRHVRDLARCFQTRRTAVVEAIFAGD